MPPSYSAFFWYAFFDEQCSFLFIFFKTLNKFFCPFKVKNKLNVLDLETNTYLADCHSHPQKQYESKNQNQYH